MMGVNSIGRTHRRMSRMVGWGLFLIGASVAMAQASTGTILGVVQDSGGAAAPYATLTARNLDTGQSRMEATAEDGSYQFSALPAGLYVIEVVYPGFRSEVRNGVTVTVGQEAVVNFTLEVRTIVRRVVVREEAPPENTTPGSLGSLADGQRRPDLPLKSRNLADLTPLQAVLQQHQSVPFGTGMSRTDFSSNGAPQQPKNFLRYGDTKINFFVVSPSTVLHQAYDESAVGLYVQDDLRGSHLTMNQLALKITLF